MATCFSILAWKMGPESYSSYMTELLSVCTHTHTWLAEKFIWVIPPGAHSLWAHNLKTKAQP